MQEASGKQMVSVKEAAERLGQHEQTIRRHIKDGSLKAERIPGKYGEYQWLVEVPQPAPLPDLDVGKLVARIEELNQLVGYWHGRFDVLDNQLRLLKEAPPVNKPVAAPMVTPAPVITSTAAPSRSWLKRLFGIK